MILEWFIFAFNAVAPILLLILLGYWLKCKGVVTPEFLKVGNYVAFHYCIPSLLFLNIYNLESLSDIQWGSTVFVVVALSILSLLGLVMGHLCTNEHSRIGVIAQTWMRSNSAIIGLPLATAIGGDAAAAVLSPLQAPAIAMYNGMSVVFLTIYSRESKGRKIDWKKILLSIPKNPLIRGLMLGLLCLFVRSLLPLGADGQPVFTIRSNLPFLYNAVTNLSRIATPFSLLVLGGRFNFSAVKGMTKEIVTACLGRLVVAPILGFSMAYAASRMGVFQMTPAMVASLIAIFASPVSVSSAPMAAEMKADEVLAGQLVVWTSIGSMFSLFALIVAFQALGWL